MTSVLKDFDEKINKAVDDTNDDGAGNAKDFSKKELDKENKKSKKDDKKDDKDSKDCMKSADEAKEANVEKAALDSDAIEAIVAKHVDDKFSNLDAKLDQVLELGKSFDNVMTKDEADGIVTTFAKAYDAVEKMHGEITKSANDMQDLITKSVKEAEKPADKEVEKSTEPAKDEKVEKAAKEVKEVKDDKVAEADSEAKVEKSTSYATKEADGAETKEAKVEKSAEPAEKEIKKSYTRSEVNGLLDNFNSRLHSEAISKSIAPAEYERLNDLATAVYYQQVDEDGFNEFIDYATKATAKVI